METLSLMQKDTATPISPHPAQCRNPFIMDPESWDCACHKIMTDKCELRKCGKGTDCFVSCYRRQLCSDPKVCSDWKKKVCTDKCVDNDKALNKALNKQATKLTCTSSYFDC